MVTIESNEFALANLFDTQPRYLYDEATRVYSVSNKLREEKKFTIEILISEYENEAIFRLIFKIILCH